MGPTKPHPKRAEKHQQDKPAHHTKPHHGKSPAPSKDSISINATKSKIRTVQRLLSHPHSKVTPGIRIEKERALAGYKADLEQAIAEKRRNEMIGKYHMVRFFERRKAERVLKKVRARLASAGLRGDRDGDGDGIEGGERDDWMKKQVHVAEVDVNYTLYYPLMEKYVSLYPKGETEDSKAGKGKGEGVVVESSSKPPLWAFVEQCMTTGTLNMLRDGKYGVKPDGSIKTREEFAPETNTTGGAEKKMKKNTSTARMPKDEDESDGGFFEK